MQSNQTTQQGEVKFKVGDKVKYKSDSDIVRDHKYGTVYTVEDIHSETRVALVESDYVAYSGSLELVSHPTKHKHCDLIVEWAKDPEGCIIQFRESYGQESVWVDCPNKRPQWYQENEYRIKPKTKEVTRWKWVFLSGGKRVMESSAYYTEEEALQQFENAIPYKLEHTAITATEEV